MSAALLCLLTSACKPFGSQAAPGSAPDATRVSFGTQSYVIPGEYDAGVTPYNPATKYAAFSLSLLLPDLSPASRKPEEFRRLGWHNQLTALVENGRQFRDPEAGLDQLLGWGHVAKQDFVKSADGCRVYKGNFTVAQEIHVCNGAFGVFETYCTEDVISPSCKTMQNIDTSATIIYTYGIKYLSNEIEIQERLRRLIANFKGRAEKEKK